MTRSEWITGLATIAAAVVLGVISSDYVNRRFPMTLTPDGRLVATTTNAPASEPTSPGPCIRADGSWKNWPFPNVPMLSPKCTN